MSEQEHAPLDEPKENSLNNPEKKIKPTPLFDECNKCGKKYQITAVNSILNIYDKQADCNNIVCKCKHCDKFTKMFIRENYLQQALLNGIPTAEQQDYADDLTYQQMLDVRRIELVKPVDITARHEKLIGGFATTLANCPDDLLYNLLTDESGEQKLPMRWI